MDESQLTPWQVVAEILGDPATWTRGGMAITAAGWAVKPEWWNYISFFGMFVCPIIAQTITEIKRRTTRVEKQAVATLVKETA